MCCPVRFPCSKGSGAREFPSDSARPVAMRRRFSNDCVFDGSLVSYAKSDPEPLLQQAALLGADPSECVAFDCEAAGIEAALKAGMRSVGVGDPCPLREATVVTGSLDGFTVDDLRWLIHEQNRKCV